VAHFYVANAIMCGKSLTLSIVLESRTRSFF